ncbi:MAG: hypothetical protein SGBAC_007285 [Bacillariaceae sp.]
METTPSTARRQALRQGADSNKIQIRKAIPLSKYYSIAKRLLDHFTAAFDDRSLNEAYIYGVRYASLCVESIPQHPAYRDRTYAMQHKEMSDKCNYVLECLEIVRQRMDAEEILREQQRKLELKKQTERQQAEAAELEARRKQEKEEFERQEATKTQMRALSKLSAMQRDLNQPSAKNSTVQKKKTNPAKTKIEKKSVAPVEENQPKKTGLVRARVDSGGSDVSPIEEIPEPTTETPENSSTASSSLMGSALSKMASIVSRKAKSTEVTEVSSQTTKKLLPAQVMETQAISNTQPVKLVKNEIKKQQSKVEKTKKPTAVPQKKKASAKQPASNQTTKKLLPAQISESPTIPKTQPINPVKNKVEKPKPKAEMIQVLGSLPQIKKASEKPPDASSSSSKKSAPLQVSKLVATPKPKPSKLESTAKGKLAQLSKKKKIDPTVKQKDVTPTKAPATKNKVSAPRRDTVEQPLKRISDVIPEELSAMETDETQEIKSDKDEAASQEPHVQHQERRPADDTFDLLAASIKAQVKRIEEIEGKLIPKLLEEARKEHQIAKSPKMAKQERMLHKRRALHCVSQKRKWEKLAETTKIAVFHMETQIFRLENAMEDQQVQEAMAEATSTIKSVGNSVGVSDLQGFSEALGAGELVKTTADGEEDEILIQELESWIGSSSGEPDKAEEALLDEDDLSILSLPSIPLQDLTSPLQSNKTEDKVSKKLVQAAT